jgi:hypothetical protein
MSRLLFKMQGVLSILLLLLWPGQECRAFVPLADLKSVKNLSVRSSTSGPDDPYELQYRQYFQTQAGDSGSTLDAPVAISDSNENTVVNNGYNPIEQHNGGEVTMQPQEQTQRPQYTTMPTSTPTSTDPYELQYQQYFQSQTTANVDYSAAAPAIQTTAQAYNSDVTSVGSNGMVDGATTYYQPVEAQSTTPPGATVQASNADPSRIGNNGVVADNAPTYFPPVVADKNMDVKKDLVPGNSVQEASQDEEELSPEQIIALEDKYLQMVSTEFGYKKLLGKNPYALTDIPVGVLFSRVLDGMEDSAIARKNKKAKPGDVNQDRPTVVVLGTGWGAQSFVKLASTLDLRILVVSPVNHFVRCCIHFAYCCLSVIVDSYTFIVVKTGFYSDACFGSRRNRW